MSFVLDASVAASWSFSDESSTIAALAYDRIQTEHVFVPTILWFELRNTLIIAERRKRQTPIGTTSFLRSLLLHRITEDRSPVETDVLTFARRHRLTVYDAAYLELAFRTGLELATLDTALATAAQAENVPLIA